MYHQAVQEFRYTPESFFRLVSPYKHQPYKPHNFTFSTACSVLLSLTSWRDHITRCSMVNPSTDSVWVFGFGKIEKIPPKKIQKGSLKSFSLMLKHYGIFSALEVVQQSREEQNVWTHSPANCATDCERSTEQQNKKHYKSLRQSAPKRKKPSCSKKCLWQLID